MTLPKLVVPKLKQTLEKYLVTVKPFLNDEDFAKTVTLVKDFEQGLGKKSQELLEKRATEHVNWLEDWWLATAYLEYRYPVVVFSNPCILFPATTIKSQKDQLRYAAQILLGTLEFKDYIDSNKFPQEMIGNNPLDMQQYKKIFGTCRIPWVKRDKLSYNNSSRHVTVIHNEHIFHLDLWGEDNILLNGQQIMEQLKKIVDDSKRSNSQAIGILTSEHRDTWAKGYQLLSKDKNNEELLADVQDSIVVLCLDAPCGYSKTTNDDHRRTLGGGQLIHGGGSVSNGGNRWLDKTVQLVVGVDGVTGLIYEHAPADGRPIAVLTDFLDNYIKQDRGENAQSLSPKTPKRLDFHITPEVASLIKKAEVNLDKLAGNFDLYCFQYHKYGKNFIKSHQLSPDSYIQMAIQFAFYRLHKQPGAQYESATTRMFEGGRTETIRSCSLESIEFAKTMLNASKRPKEKVAALRSAINSHKQYTVQALHGLGVDRHLLGLKLAAITNGLSVHELFSDVGYRKSAHMRISTSQVAFKTDALVCFAPLVPDGYATCYNPRDNDIIFSTSAFKDNDVIAVEEYKHALEASLEDMHNVLEQHTFSKI